MSVVSNTEGRNGITILSKKNVLFKYVWHLWNHLLEIDKLIYIFKHDSLKYEDDVFCEYWIGVQGKCKY